MVLLEQSTITELKQLAEAASPEEFCAILLGRRTDEHWEIVDIVVVRNMDERPRSGFSMAPQALIAAEKQARPRGLRIVGFAHSHPGGAARPSVRDAESAFWPECVYGIVGAEGVRWWRMSSDEMEEVEARVR